MVDHCPIYLNADSPEPNSVHEPISLHVALFPSQARAGSLRPWQAHAVRGFVPMAGH